MRGMFGARAKILVDFLARRRSNVGQAELLKRSAFSELLGLGVA